ncbi:uncharacterized protein F5891DRAFT_986141 [Suillus fuscotomentosus]|uniref:26S proteasome regulatory subunit Rpn7 N-terminal domain-containing protein n=1 Tax=Suillus fuscotomentosus TaxID=1912939 RepID=A0AAD4DSR6_9AGAM|nr:uncharacterized protein F5891DRAFT_986141 [Suillus fuscotomentosus]KAG1848410.1 hypothetical protein C8R48DRAFT_677330 [Suillus tomentosus]KAG1893147.1 hypothetical protein F5891DRAFT_986141 [Suillus fuscotomentosus]
MISIRQLEAGGTLLLDGLSTFTATELTTYNDFVALTIIIKALTLKRVDLKKRLITAPEVISVLSKIPILGDLLNSLYDCYYAKFFVALDAPPVLVTPLASYLLLCMRDAHLAYSQLLESYRSLTLESLSGAFGVGV